MRSRRRRSRVPVQVYLAAALLFYVASLCPIQWMMEEDVIDGTSWHDLPAYEPIVTVCRNSPGFVGEFVARYASLLCDVVYAVPYRTSGGVI